MQIHDVDDTVFTDERGWVLDPSRLAEAPPTPYPGLHVVSIEPGAVRGNHRHPGVREWMLVFGAPVTVAGRTAHEDPHVVRLAAPGPRWVEFGPGEAHAVRGEGPGTSYVVAFNDRADPDTERVEPLLESPPDGTPPPGGAPSRPGGVD